MNSCYQDIPESLPGINIRSALNRMGGNRKLFLRVICEFNELYADSGDQIKAALKSGNLELAAQIAHKIKGVAGIFSADELYASAGNFEDAVKEKTDQAFESLLEDFCLFLKQVLSSISILEKYGQDLDAFHEEAANSIPQKSPEFITSSIKELERVLDRNNPEAEKIMENLKPYLVRAGFAQETACIEKNIRIYNYREASRLLMELHGSFVKKTDT